MRKHFYPVTVPLKLITLREVNKDRHLLLLFFCNIEVTRGCTTMPDRRGLRAAYQADEWARGGRGRASSAPCLKGVRRVISSSPGSSVSRDRPRGARKSPTAQALPEPYNDFVDRRQRRVIDCWPQPLLGRYESASASSRGFFC
jgi:hypothetical protein